MRRFISVRWLLLLIPVLLVGCGSGESGTLKGKASFNERPLDGVKITAVSTTRFGVVEEVTTDDGGAFLISGLPAGDYEVSAFRDGYSFSPEKRALALDGPQGADEANFAATRIGAPSAPNTLTVSEKAGGASLNWEATGDKTLVYSLFRWVDGEAIPVKPLAANLSSLFFNDNSVEPGKTYHYSVTAFNAKGESALSDTVSVTPSGSEPLLGGVFTTGQGGLIQITNGTPHTWNQSHQGSYQMNTWDFPATIAPGDSATYYIEFDTSIGITTTDDIGDVTYELGDTGLSFSITAFVTETKIEHLFSPDEITLHFNGKVDYTNLDVRDADNNPYIIEFTFDPGSVDHKKGVKEIVLVGKEGYFPSLTKPIDWMQKTLEDSIGEMKLGQITIPGSHDAAMSTLTGHNFGTNENTITQRATIYNQLIAGSRYIDLRPVYREIDGYFTSGHYQDQSLDGLLNKAYKWLLTQHGPDYLLPAHTFKGLPTVDLGGTGQSIADIISDINAFTQQYKELVILNLSHDRYIDAASMGREFTQPEWDNLLQQLADLNHLFVVDETQRDLSQLTMNDYLKPNGTSSAAVVVIVDNDDTPVTLDNGFYPLEFFSPYNCYSNTDEASTMASYQGKVLDNANKDSLYSMASWTLTMPAWKAAMSSVATLGGLMDSEFFEVLSPVAALSAEAFGSVLDLADLANTNVTNPLFNLTREHGPPNIIYFDSVTDIPAGQLAMALNYSYPDRKAPLHAYTPQSCPAH